MSIYMQREYNIMRISFNRADRDYAMLKKDYEKLYEAYYSYDKKILKILEGSKNVFWAEDSSAYVVKTNNTYVFSFYKKPRMQNAEYDLWIESPASAYGYIARVNELKPHEFIFCEIRDDVKSMFVGKRNEKMYEVHIPIKGSEIISIDFSVK